MQDISSINAATLWQKLPADLSLFFETMYSTEG